MIRWVSAKLRCDFSSEKASSIGREIPKVPLNPLKGRPPHVAEGTRESFQRVYALRKAKSASPPAYK